MDSRLRGNDGTQRVHAYEKIKDEVPDAVLNPVLNSFQDQFSIRDDSKSDILSGFTSVFSKATRLRVQLRRGKRVTEKDYYKYFLLFLDEKKQKSPT